LTSGFRRVLAAGAAGSEVVPGGGGRVEFMLGSRFPQRAFRRTKNCASLHRNRQSA
jgi:hypothetical protein